MFRLQAVVIAGTKLREKVAPRRHLTTGAWKFAWKFSQGMANLGF
jgi:hypothetical protein